MVLVLVLLTLLLYSVTKETWMFVYCLQVATISATAFRVSLREWKYCEFQLDELRCID